MFLIEGDGKTILYTGDFKNTNSVKDILKDKVIDVLITEGTNVFTANRNYNLKSELDIKNKLSEISKEYDGTMFVLCSSTNEDRIITLEQVGEETGRAMFYDYFVRAIRGDSPKAQKHSFVANGVSKKKNSYFKKLIDEGKLVGVDDLMKVYPKSKKIVLVRQSMEDFIGKYLCKPENQGKNHVLVYSIWNGYKETEYTKNFLSCFAKRNIDVVDCHCTGHAYQNSIKDLISITNPVTVIPIHCESSDRDTFKDLHKNCNMLSDGDVYNID